MPDGTDLSEAICWRRPVGANAVAVVQVVEETREMPGEQIPFPMREHSPRRAYQPGSAAPTRQPLQVAGLFSGVGGIELGLSRSGHVGRLLCEFEPGAQAVLAARFPEIPLHDDVTTLANLPEGVELLAGGFPCQDLSQAGKTKGIGGARSGLVGEVFRLLEAQRVPWVLLENVPFMLQLGRGEALEVIVSMLEFLGYKWAYRVVDSRSFGLPQRRRRVLMLASLDGDPREVLLADDAGTPDEPPASEWRKRACGFYWTEGVRGLGWAHDAVPTLKAGSTVGIPSPPAIVLPDRRVVTPNIVDAERMQGFEPGWTAATTSVTRASHRWKLVGNAVTVDVAEWVGARLRSPGVYVPFGDRAMARGRTWPTAGYNVDGRRMVTEISEWPASVPRRHLAEFLTQEPASLSMKATRGFLNRANKGSLRFPPGFLEIVEAHLTRAAKLAEAA